MGIFYARWRYGVDLRRANPVDAVKSSAVPVLLIHGEEDINILPVHSRLLAQADPVHAQLWLVPGAQHCGAVGVAHDEFWSRVLNFLAHHNGAPAASTESASTFLANQTTSASLTKQKPRVITTGLLGFHQAVHRTRPATAIRAPLF
jgi:fermentation-respiration switch protein FrsA (DUF1100 family)